MTPLVLAGVKHSGKSTIGSLLAQELKCPFFDLDDKIEALLPQGFSIRTFYQQRGQEAFQALEWEAFQPFLKKKKPFILSLGGASLENTPLREYLKDQNWTKMGLNNQPKVLYNRISKRGLPPFLKTADPYGTFLELYQRRLATIEQVCPIVLNLYKLSPREAVQQILGEI